MTTYAKNFNPNKTPQSEAIPGKAQVANNAGGYVFALDQWKRLERFLILGSDAPTYYQSAKALTRENGETVIACWAADAERTANTICDISHSGRAPRQSPALFALALGTLSTNMAARQEAYKAVQIVCRTASHLFEWLSYCSQLGKGSGRGMKRALANWYGARKTDNLAYQMVKYRSRNGFDHKRAIELSNKGAGEDEARKALYLWARGKEFDKDKLPEIVGAHRAAMELKPTESKGDTLAIVDLVGRFRLPWEGIPTEALRSAEIWETMLPDMGLTALVRNLGNMTEVGAIGPQKTQPVVERLKDGEALRKSRVHPFAILQALAVYKSGHGFKGSKSWKPESKVCDALNDAFYAAFANVTPTGKRFYLGLDVSGSMGTPMMGSPLTCREAAAALALVTASVEDEVVCYGFTAGNSGYGGKWGGDPVTMRKLDISPKRRLDDVVKSITNLPFGGTDCALPMLHALDEGIKVDAFVVLTDNETWAGDVHPVQALQSYRQKTGIPAKLIVVGMTSSGFSIADPSDGGMLDLVGFDSNGPALIADFVKN